MEDDVAKVSRLMRATPVNVDDVQFHECVSVLICPSIRGGTWWRRMLEGVRMVAHTLTGPEVWRHILWPHRGQPCPAEKCYRLIIAINGRRQFAWRHRGRPMEAGDGR